MFVDWSYVSGSTAIRAIGIERYDGPPPVDPPPPGTYPVRVHIRFDHGTTYVYTLPNSGYYDKFISSPSKGRYYDFIIKARFDYVRKY